MIKKKITEMTREEAIQDFIQDSDKFDMENYDAAY